MAGNKFVRNRSRVQPTPSVCISRKPGEQPPTPLVGMRWSIVAKLPDVGPAAGWTGTAEAMRAADYPEVRTTPIITRSEPGSTWAAFWSEASRRIFITIRLTNSAGAEVIWMADIAYEGTGPLRSLPVEARTNMVPELGNVSLTIV